MTPPDTKSTKEGLRATLADLTALHGAPGFEQPLVKYFQGRVAGLADRVDVDGHGNVTAAKNGRQPSSTTRDLPVVMGRGPVVLLAASTNIFRGSIAHPAMKRYLLAATESERIPVQLATHLLRGSTEAASIHLTRDGVPTISVGTARRYSYSPNEVVDLNDLALAVRLLARFVGDMETHTDLGFLSA